jgi:hypothetical protein
MVEVDFGPGYLGALFFSLAAAVLQAIRLTAGASEPSATEVARGPVDGEPVRRS